MLRFVSALALIGGLHAPAQADVRLPAVFSDGMVLQQKASVPIWGWAAPREVVTLRFAGSESPGLSHTTTADEAGRWQVDLATPEAGGPYSIEVSSDAGAVKIDNVLIGEVWLCSGQSNMEWLLQVSIAASRKSGALPLATTDLDRPEIRFFDIPKTYASQPRDDCDARWWTAKGDDALRCSAVAYYFACQLQDSLNVPVGLVVSAWGGTRAEAWTSTEVVSQFPDHALAIERVKAADPATHRRNVESYWRGVDDKRFWTREFKSRAFDDSAWETQVQPAMFETGPVGEHDGIVWYRREIDVPREWEAQDLALELPPIDDIDETFWNGVSVGSMVEAGSHSRPRRYTVPAALVSGGTAVLAIRVLDTGGPGGLGSVETANGRPAMCLARGDETIDLAGPWKVRRGAPAAGIPAPPMPASTNQNTPASLYNGMIAPILPFGIRGAIWYQGESNRYRAEEYRALFPAMIVDWRTRWNNLELPFYFVQLAPYEYGPGDEGDKTAIVREAQAQTAENLPMTGMALTADIGNPRDIHPIDKWTVGDRLARFALRDVYDQPNIIADGPKLRSVVPVGDTLRVDFDHVHGKLSRRGETLAHFEVAGRTGDYVPATASISPDGQSVLLSADGVDAPTDARYLWDDAAEATLMGGRGLPAAPFRTR